MFDEDNLLVILANTGNPKALNSLLKKYKKLIKMWIKKYEYAEKYGLDQEELEQVCICALYNSLSRYNVESRKATFKTYANKVVRNAALTEIKNCRRFVGNGNYLYLDDLVYEDGDGSKLSYEEIIPAEGPEFTTLMIRDEEITAKVASFLQDEINLSIIDLKAKGYTSKEISEILGIPIKDVYNRMYRIRQKLKS